MKKYLKISYAIGISIGLLWLSKILPTFSNVAASDPIRHSVVSIHSSMSEGSGFRINSNVILTAAHVVTATSQNGKVRVPSQVSVFDGQVIHTFFVAAYDIRADVAILAKTAITQADKSAILESVDLNCQNKKAVSYGFARLDKLHKVPTHLKKVIRRDGKFFYAGVGSIIPGMSGGPVLSEEGKLCGLNSYVWQGHLNSLTTGSRRYSYLSTLIGDSPSGFALARYIVNLL